MVKILLSKQKLEELKKERDTLSKEIYGISKGESEDGLMSYSWKDEAVLATQLAPKRKRLKELENLIKNASVLEEKSNDGKIDIGSEVELRYSSGKKNKIRLVHPVEADPLKSLISVESPLGKQLFNKKVGDGVTSPSGEQISVESVG